MEGTGHNAANRTCVRLRRYGWEFMFHPHISTLVTPRLVTAPKLRLELTFFNLDKRNCNMLNFDVCQWVNIDIALV